MKIRSYFQNSNKNKNGKSLDEFIKILKETIREDCYLNRDRDEDGNIILIIQAIKKIVDPDVYKKGEGFTQKDIVDRISSAIDYSVIISDYNKKEHIIKCTVAGNRVKIIVKPNILRHVSTYTPVSSEVAGNPTASTTNSTNAEKNTATVGKTVKSTWTSSPDWKPKKKNADKPINRKEKAEPEPAKPKVKKYKSRTKVFLNDDERFPIFKLDSPSNETK